VSTDELVPESVLAQLRDNRREVRAVGGVPGIGAK